MAGTSLLAPLAAAILAAGPAAGLPFDRVAPGTDHVVFYRVEGDHQFLFVYRMPGRMLQALEIDRRERDGDEDGEEAAEVVHHLPISRLAGRIQYLEVDRLPGSRRALLALTRKRAAVVEGVRLEATGSTPDHWLGLAPDGPPRP
ncbi:hypothetical protein [Dokdonella sp.]|uniref:hypothetical protein n=1 Tax=Dokdonella sp. TaxID=2291710 RepID=UPI0027B90D2E|nr:hypothetical protein [Dokdonella sp.]